MRTASSCAASPARQRPALATGRAAPRRPPGRYALIAGGVALPIVRRRLRLHPAGVLGGAHWRRLRRRSSGRVAAGAMWRSVCSRCTSIWLPTRCPTTTRRRSRRACVSTPDRARQHPRRGQVPDDAPPARAAQGRPLQRRGAGARLGPLGLVCDAARLLLYVRARNPRRFLARRHVDLRGLRPRRGDLLAVPDRAPLVCRGAGAAWRIGRQTAVLVRRLMVETASTSGVGARRGFTACWWEPLAAMPSLHFATSSMAAVLLSETGAAPGAVGVAYAGLLGFALVYLGEHYAST